MVPDLVPITSLVPRSKFIGKLGTCSTDGFESSCIVGFVVVKQNRYVYLISMYFYVTRDKF